MGHGIHSRIAKSLLLATLLVSTATIAIHALLHPDRIFLAARACRKVESVHEFWDWDGVDYDSSRDNYIQGDLYSSTILGAQFVERLGFDGASHWRVGHGGRDAGSGKSEIQPGLSDPHGPCGFLALKRYLNEDPRDVTIKLIDYGHPDAPSFILIITPKDKTLGFDEAWYSFDGASHPPDAVEIHLTSKGPGSMISVHFTYEQIAASQFEPPKAAGQ